MLPRISEMAEEHQHVKRALFGWPESTDKPNGWCPKTFRVTGEVRPNPPRRVDTTAGTTTTPSVRHVTQPRLIAASERHTQVRANDNDFAVVEPTLPSDRCAGQEHAVLPHNTEDPLMVGHRLPGFDQLPIGQRGDAAIAVGRPLVHQAADQRQEVPSSACDTSHAASLADGLLHKSDLEHIGDHTFIREASFGCDKSRKLRT